MTNRKQFESLMREYFRRHYLHELGLTNWEKLVKKRIKGIIGEEQIKLISKYLKLEGLKLEGKVLDVGCGTGEFLVSAAKRGCCEVFGIEPNYELVYLAKMRLRLNKIDGKIIRAIGENIPFKDNTFDIVTSFSVLEHVNNPFKVIDEMLRVSKKIVFIHFPNYVYPYEWHYKMFWIPLMPKRFAKFYLKLRGRKPDFIDSINYITARSVIKYLKNRSNIKIKIGVIERINNPELAIKHKSLCRLLAATPFIPKLISYISPGVDIIVEVNTDE